MSSANVSSKLSPRVSVRIVVDVSLLFVCFEEVVLWCPSIFMLSDVTQILLLLANKPCPGHSGLVMAPLAAVMAIVLPLFGALHVSILLNFGLRAPQLKFPSSFTTYSIPYPPFYPHKVSSTHTIN
jgi:hypothetical protein